MAPNRAAGPPYAKDEKVLCFHHEMLYEAKILEVRQDGDGLYQYKIHYKGWKNTWDDWVPQDRIRKFNDENRELASQLMQQARASLKNSKPASKKTALKNGSDFSSARGSEERTGAAAVSGRGPRRARDYDMEQEEAFHSRPAIKLVIPDHIKGILVDDWEHITKNGMLVELPHKKATVDKILQDYLEAEKPNREAESTQMDILIETIDGLREYFDKALGRILLYRFERLQYAEVSKTWTADKGPSSTYGVEHLARLLVSLPELIAQTNMDQQSVSRLREELTKFMNWLTKTYQSYFIEEYTVPPVDYTEKTKSG